MYLKLNQSLFINKPSIPILYGRFFPLTSKHSLILMHDDPHQVLSEDSIRFLRNLMTSGVSSKLAVMSTTERVLNITAELDSYAPTAKSNEKISFFYLIQI